MQIKCFYDTFAIHHYIDTSEKRQNLLAIFESFCVFFHDQIFIAVFHFCWLTLIFKFYFTLLTTCVVMCNNTDFQSNLMGENKSGVALIIPFILWSALKTTTTTDAN